MKASLGISLTNDELRAPEHWGCNRVKGIRTDQELQLMKSSPDIVPSAVQQ